MERKVIIGVLVAGMVAGSCFCRGWAQGKKEQGLVMYLNFDEGKGTMAKDSSGKGNDAEINGAGYPQGGWVKGKFGSALDFNGEDNYAEREINESLELGANNFTFEAWINCNKAEGKWRPSPEVSDRSPIYCASSNKWWIAATNYGIMFQQLVSPWPSVASPANSIQNHIWYHIAVVGEGPAKRLYINGAFQASKDIPVENGEQVVIGKFSNEYFDGLIDEVKLYNRALTADEMKAHYQQKMAIYSEIIPVDEEKKKMKEEKEKMRVEEELLRKKFFVSSLSQKEKLSLQDIRADTQVNQFSRFEIALKVLATYDNPFNPEDIEIKGRFISPSGKEYSIPGFFYQPFEKRGKSKTEQITPTDNPHFGIRFCPAEAGQYKYWVEIKDRNGQIKSEVKAFVSTSSKSKGFVRRSKDNPLYFSFDDNSTYFAIGHNVCWATTVSDYDNYFTKMSENGENYTRIWVGPFDIFTLERVPKNKEDYAGLGKYDLQNAWRFDYALELAEEKGIYIMFCIDSFNSLRMSPQYAQWDKCPYNKANGGPCQNPEEFFTNEEAKKLFKQRLSYVVARYSYSPNILTWEFWNEVDIIEKYIPEQVREWHIEMGRHLRQIDPFKHLVTTSFARTTGDPQIDSLEELDFVQSHNYNSKDIAKVLSQFCIDKARQFKKPHIFGEFGADVTGQNDVRDTKGFALHDGIWAPPFSLSAGTGMQWWWDNQIEPRNLYYHFKAFANFIRGVEFCKQKFDIAEVELSYTAKPKERMEVIDLEGKHSVWTDDGHPSNTPQTIKISSDGKFEGAENLSKQLHGTGNHPAWHNPVTFEVDYKKKSKFSVLVSGVSDYGGAALKIYLDGEVALDKDFPDIYPDRVGTMKDYDGEYSIEIPQGKHTIKFENEGKDWVHATYRFSIFTTEVPLSVFVLSDPTAKDIVGLAWIKNRANTWFRRLILKENLETVESAILKLKGLNDGSYKVEWWDTYKGEVQSEEKVTCKDKTLILQIPPVLEDIACKIWK